jgi:hypothetical protein
MVTIGGHHQKQDGTTPQAHNGHITLSTGTDNSLTATPNQGGVVPGIVANIIARETRPETCRQLFVNLNVLHPTDSATAMLSITDVQLGGCVYWWHRSNPHSYTVMNTKSSYGGSKAYCSDDLPCQCNHSEPISCT